MAAAPISEPLSSITLAQKSATHHSLLEGSAHTASAAETRVAKADEPLGYHPLLFDTSLILGGQLAALAAAAAAAVKGVLGGGMPHPLLPFGFPFGAPPVGSAFAGATGTGLGLHLLAVLALLLVLSRISGTSLSPREAFRLVSSPRLVTELPG